MAELADAQDLGFCAARRRGSSPLFPIRNQNSIILGKATLKIETEARDDQQTKLIAELDSETLEKYKHQAARKIAQSQKIPGFRPGKAPYNIVLRMVGDEALQQEAIELMLDEVYPEALREANINASGPGKLEEIVSMDPPKFAFIVPLQPEITLGDYKEVRKDYNPEPVTDEQVEATIRRLQRSYATAEPVERAAQKGDLVSFMLSAKRVQPDEGEPEDLVAETPYQMIAGEVDEDQEEVWPYENFTDELIGVTADETKKITHTFSDESPYEDLRGKEAEFTITVQSVKELHLPELTDEFAQSLGEFENLDELRKVVRSQLEQNQQQQYDQEYFDGLIDTLVEQAAIKYPPHMLDEEVEEFLHGLQHNLEHDHMDLETYLKMRDVDRETFIDQEVKPAAVRRLERSLVLEEFARQEQVEVKNEEIRSIYQMAMQQTQQSKELGQLPAKGRQNSQELANSIAVNTVNSIFNQRIMGRLKAIATGKGDEEPEAAVELVEAEGAEAEAVAQPEAETDVVESSPMTSELAAEEEQDAAESDLQATETQQTDEAQNEGNA